MSQIKLPNGCACSEPTLNCGGKNPTIAKPWYIQYWFYDPELKGTKDYPKLKIFRGQINTANTIAERKIIAKETISELLHLLKTEGYNPITGKCKPVENIAYEIEPSTPFVTALQEVAKRIDGADSTKSDLSSIIKGVETAALNLWLTSTPISEIRRKHIKAILDQLKVSNSRYNKYRSYLMMLFKELLEIEAIDNNPINDISKRKVEQKLRKLLTEDERILINNSLKKNYYTFWRCIHIFFHSGSRETEMMNVQVKHIDLERQRFKVQVKKGRVTKWQERPIKSVVLHLWKELIAGASADDFIFSKGLVPGQNKISPAQLTRRWREHVKKKLDIDADFYSLKHLNIDETAAALDIQSAAAMAGHTTPVITLKHYALGEKERQMQKLINVQNTF